MTSPAAAWALAAAGATALLGLLYRALWFRFYGRRRTPTGFGALLGPTLLGAVLLTADSHQLMQALALVTAGAFAYWFDDLFELSAWLRVAICFVVGSLVGLIYLLPGDAMSPLLVLLALLAGFINVAVVNTVNFQDGADLNLATFILLTAILLLLYSGVGSDWRLVAAACLAFTLPFALMNSRPKTLYLGDAGSFAFGSLFTIFAGAFIAGPQAPPPECAIPAALPLVDTIFVTAHRIHIRQPFTTRHYFHLYQRLQRERNGFGYLVPQVANVLLCLLLARAFHAAGLGRTISVVLAMASVTPLFFVACRRFFVLGEPGPPQPRWQQ